MKSQKKTGFGPAIGKASLHFDKFKKWYLSEGINWGKEQWSKVFYADQNVCGGRLFDIYHHMYGISYQMFSDEDKLIKRDQERILEAIKHTLDYITKYNLSFDLLYKHKHEIYGVIGFGSANNQFIIPIEFLDIQLLNDYSTLTAIELQQLTASSSSNLVPAAGLTSCSIKTVQSELSKKKEEAKGIEQEIEDVKNAATGELADMQKQINEQIAAMNAKKEEMMAKIAEKKAELQQKVTQLENQIFVLDTTIYGIRCFLGEVTNFIQLRKGLPAANDTPVVLYQKIRFLDEELGKLVSLYDIDWENKNDIEELLASRQDVFDTFCPSSKCVSLVRISKNNTYFAPDDKYCNMLKEYEVYHGTKIGILVRSNENLYFGWTDEERVNIHDNLFFTPEEKVINPEDAKSLEQTSSKEEVASRYFIFSILQGLIENENHLITLPEKQSILSPSQYVIYSAADNWFEDKRFGNFSDIIDRCNECTKTGHFILTVQSLFPNHHNYEYHNDRGRGYKDRTSDCSVHDATIYPINLIEKDEYPILRYDYKSFDGKKYESTTRNIHSTFDENVDNIRQEMQCDYHYYVSVIKGYSDCDARSNFEVYPREFINLTFFNSVWLLYAINTKNIGGWHIGGNVVDYAYAIKYLNKALEFVKTREVKEAALISKYYPSLDSIPEWQVKLSEWKMDKTVSTITDFQAKRFAKALTK